ncbi:hypothetical protein ASE39_24630 [Acidovorax sp. Root267]|nr:hypothetical protein ASE39_24630 [Acidovorax sp. Root267]
MRLLVGVLVVGGAALRAIRAAPVSASWRWISLRLAAEVPAITTHAILAITLLPVALLTRAFLVIAGAACLELPAITAGTASLIIAAVALVVAALAEPRVIGISAHAVMGKVAIVAVSVAHS